MQLLSKRFGSGVAEEEEKNLFSNNRKNNRFRNVACVGSPDPNRHKHITGGVGRGSCMAQRTVSAFLDGGVGGGLEGHCCSAEVVPFFLFFFKKDNNTPI